MSAWKGLQRREQDRGIGVFEVEDLLTSLTEKSLVVTDESGRWRLLETVRDYGRGQAADAAEAVSLRGRHLEYFLALAEEAESHLVGADQQAWLERLETEHDNLRAALEWCSEKGGGGDSDNGLRLAGSLWQFWAMRGYFSEGRGWLSALLDSKDVSLSGGTGGSAARAKALNGAGALAFRQGDDLAARALFEESLSIRRELSDQRGIAGSLSNLGLVAFGLSEYLASRAFTEESLAIRRELADGSGIATSLNNLGMVACEQGDYPAAWALYEESLAIERELGDRSGIATSLNNLGLVACEQGDYSAARAFYEESIRIFRELGYWWGLANALEGLAPAIAALGGPNRAARIWGSAERLREEIGAPLSRKERPRYERHVSATRAPMNSDEAFTAAWQEGRAMSLEQAIELALRDAED